MQKATYPPEKITVKVQNNSQPASKKSVFQRLGSKSKLAAGDLSLEEQCKELRRQIKMESGGSSSARKRAQKRHKESSSSSGSSSSGSSSDSSSSSSSSQSSPTRRRSKKTRKPHHHSSSSVDHLAAKIRKTSAAAASSSSHHPSAKVAASSASSKLVKKHKAPRAVDSPAHPPSSSSRRRSASPASPGHRSRGHPAHDLKKRDHHRSKELLHPKESASRDHPRDHSSRLTHDSRVRSRSPRHLSRTSSTRDPKRRLTPLDTKRGHSPPHAAPRSTSNRSVDRDRERREKVREEREIARNKEREEALLRCQERQRERERLARDRERKETGRSREKSLDRDVLKPRMHLSGGSVGRGSVERRSRGREMMSSGPRVNFDRRNSPVGDSYEFDQRSNAADGYRGGRPREGHRESIGGGGGGYEKEFVRGGVVGGRERTPPPYKEIPPPRGGHGSEKYRTSGGGAYDYEPRGGGGPGGPEGGRMSGGFGEVRGGGWEEEKAHKIRETIQPPRERMIDRGAGGPGGKDWGAPGPYRGDGPKDWSAGGNKWENPKFGQAGGGPSGGRDEMWRGGPQGGDSQPPHMGGGAAGKPDNWRNNSYQEEGSSWKDTQSSGGGGGPGGHYGYSGHHNQSSHHNQQGPSGPGGPPQGQQGGGGGGPRMMMNPRYNDSWHHKPRFAKKEFYPRHQFQAGGSGGHDGGPGGDQQQSHPRFPNQQKRFGDYQNFSPRGMMNQGPKFNAPLHNLQPHHQNVQPGGGPQGPETPIKPRVEPPSVAGRSPSSTATHSAVVPPASAKIEDVGTPTEDEKKTVVKSASGEGGEDLAEGDNLSEFSDDGDDILVLPLDELKQQSLLDRPAVEEGVTVPALAVGEPGDEKEKKEAGGEEDPEDDLTLDFEEISDGELEEESSKVKGLGDALGVDWAGLVAAVREPREKLNRVGDLKATVKEMWEPKRIFRDVGISVRMAGRELAERLLGVNKEEEEKTADGLIRVIKKEPLDEGEEEEMPTETVKEEQQQQTVKKEEGEKEIHVDLGENPIAGCQVALRRRMMWRSNLIVNRSVGGMGTGVNPVALCARRDLQIRRQLCGLPAGEIRLGRAADEQQQSEMKALALEVFAKATAVH